MGFLRNQTFFEPLQKKLKQKYLKSNQIQSSSSSSAAAA